MLLKYLTGAFALALYASCAYALWRAPLPFGTEINGLLIGVLLVMCFAVVQFLTTAQQIKRRHVKN